MSRILVLVFLLSSYLASAQYFIPPTEGEFDTVHVNPFTYVNGKTDAAALILDVDKVDAYEENGFLFTKDGKEFFVPVDSIQRIQLKSFSGRDILMERVKIDHSSCESVSEKYQKPSYLLQLASVVDTQFVKIYVVPGFEEGGMETYPFGKIDAEGEKKFNDEFEEGASIPAYFGQEEYYFQVNDLPAFRTNRYTYRACGGYIFQESSSFVKRYYLPKVTKKKKSSKRKRSKRATKRMTSKSDNVVKLYWEDIPKQVKEFGKLYKYDLERKAKRGR